MVQLQVVVGAGAVGSATVRQLAGRGERVRVISRTGRGPELPGVERVAADASDSGRMRELTGGAMVIYNCLNPDYHRWPLDWPPMAAALLSAAEAAGAVLATVGNLYVYGPVSGPITADQPLAATGTKAGVRIAMWRDALAAHEAGRVRVTEVRGSDYVCAGRTSHLGDLVAGRLVAGKSAQFIVPIDHPHTFTSVEDVAATLVAAAASERAWGRAWTVPSAPALTPRQAARDIAVAAGHPTASIRVLPAWATTVLGLGVPFLREMGETRHEWDRPFLLDGSLTTAELGVHATPWEQSVSVVVTDSRMRATA